VKLSPRLRRRLPVVVLVIVIAGAGGWYWQHQRASQFADRPMDDIPKEEYEKWMQDLGYVD
jgi:uncharacterized protein HemX